MIYPIVFLIGGALGWFRAAKRGGQLADKLQYGAVFGIMFMIVTLFAVIIAGMFGLI
ncbi:MAG: hypothetical protein JKY31_01730 [Rhodobacteraceae bacterium]|nr:hypothetical protein [Paracoccaceae bacterium]